MKVRRALETALWLVLAGCVPAFGQFSPISTPTSTYTGSTTLIPITAADFTSLTSLTNGTPTIALSTPSAAPFIVKTASSLFFPPWGSPPNTEGSTPKVLTIAGEDVTSVTLALSAASTTFGLEIQPGFLDIFPVSASFYNGNTLLGTVSRNINGDAGAAPGAGALLMAASSTTPITRVVITLPAGPNGALGVAMAQFRYTQASSPPPIPTLSTAVVGSLGLLLAGAGALLARSQGTARA